MFRNPTNQERFSRVWRASFGFRSPSQHHGAGAQAYPPSPQDCLEEMSGYAVVPPVSLHWKAFNGSEWKEGSGRTARGHNRSSIAGQCHRRWTRTVLDSAWRKGDRRCWLTCQWLQKVLEFIPLRTVCETGLLHKYRQVWTQVLPLTEFVMLENV